MTTREHECDGCGARVLQAHNLSMDAVTLHWKLCCDCAERLVAWLHHKNARLPEPLPRGASCNDACVQETALP